MGPDSDLGKDHEHRYRHVRKLWIVFSDWHAEHTYVIFKDGWAVIVGNQSQGYTHFSVNTADGFSRRRYLATKGRIDAV